MVSDIMMFSRIYEIQPVVSEVNKGEERMHVETITLSVFYNICRIS
jgi:hypothetical protein